MSQCVPSWDLDNFAPPRPNVLAHSNSANSLPFDVPSLECEQVAELTWENGQLAMHGLAAMRVGPTKPPVAGGGTTPIKYASWDKPRASGTLESIVNQATTHHHHTSAAAGKNVNEIVPWVDHCRAEVNASSASAAATVTMDALVPCNNNRNAKSNKNKNIENQENSSHVVGSVPHVLGCSTLVGSCSGGGSAADGGARGGKGGRAGICKCGASESATGRLSRQVTVDNTYSEREFGGGGPTSTSLWSPENTSSGGDYTRTSVEDLDSFCHSRSQREANDDRKKKATGKSSASIKTRAAAIHNQSERKRRDKINQRMKTLQKMVPNSSKTDKASMLDEVIEYLKQLQAQVHMMSRMNMPSMMMPLAMQQLQMSMMAPAAMGMGMGVMDMTNMGRAPVMPPTSAFVPVPPWDIQGVDRPQPSPGMMPDLLSSFLACQSQPNPMTVDAYSRLAAMYQQFQQPHAPGPKN
ncbi:hypothetical protein CASFOL_031182 [Castilleja foliolosa]|uniref:BHLH domain-containing protein n=1 Tax=Castilleja foliolosa TaxID=1961234 RepID=A0ABD3C4Y7_9LAMI